MNIKKTLLTALAFASVSTFAATILSTNFDGATAVPGTATAGSGAQSITGVTWSQSGVTALTTVSSLNSYNLSNSFNTGLWDGNIACTENMNIADRATPRGFLSTFTVGAETLALSGVTIGHTHTNSGPAFQAFASDMTVTITDTADSSVVWTDTTNYTYTLAWKQTLYNLTATSPQLVTGHTYTISVSMENMPGGGAYAAWNEITLSTSSGSTEIVAYDAVDLGSGGYIGAPTYADFTAIQAALPAKLQVGSVDAAAVTWADTNTYNHAIAATYTFTGTVGTLETGFVDATSPITTVTTTVTVAPLTEIVTYDAISDINGFTQGFADEASIIATLPTTATITETSDTTPVTLWEGTGAYDGASAGTYTFTGTLGTLPAGYVDAISPTTQVTVDVILTVGTPPTQASGTADIHTAAGWSSGTIPNASLPGIVNADCLINDAVGKIHVNVADAVYTIAADKTVTRGQSTGRIDFSGATDITIDGTLDLFGSTDDVTSSWFEDTTKMTVNSGGLLTLDDTASYTEVILFSDSQISVNGGTVQLDYVKFNTTGSALFHIASGSVNFDAVPQWVTTGGKIDFADGSTGNLDVAAHVDATTAETFWSGLWTAKKLTYNGKDIDTYAGTRAQTAFGDVFQIDATSFALEVNSTLTPAIGLTVTQEGTQLSWTIADEIGVKMYQIIDANSGKILETVIPENGSYSTTLPEGITGKLIVVDNSGFSQTFIPTDGNIVKVAYDLNEGWNLIAMPGDNADTSAIDAAFWGWNGSAYELVTNPIVGNAVWVYSPVNRQVVISAEKVETELVLESGWNMVGPTENIKIPEAAHTVYGWNEDYQNIAIEDGVLIQGIGYWIFSL